MRRGTLRVRGAIAVRSAAAPGGRQTSAPNRSRRGIRPISAKEGGVRVVLRGPGKVLHMGEKGFAGTGADFSHDSAVYECPSRRVDALPCAHRGVCAHGSMSTNLDDSRRTAVFQRKPASAPSGHRSPMCEPPPSPPSGRGSLRSRTRARAERSPARPRHARARVTGRPSSAMRTTSSAVTMDMSPGR